LPNSLTSTASLLVVAILQAQHDRVSSARCQASTGSYISGRDALVWRLCAGERGRYKLLRADKCSVCHWQHSRLCNAPALHMLMVGTGRVVTFRGGAIKAANCRLADHASTFAHTSDES
jgi:hypothetical protein